MKIVLAKKHHYPKTILVLAATLMASWNLLAISKTQETPQQPMAELPMTWEQIDKQIKPQIYQLNVGIKIKVGESYYAYVSDLSPRMKYPVFSVSTEDKGYKVIGFGTSFPIKTSRTDGPYFLTNRHVADTGSDISEECQRFFAGLRLYAEQTSTGLAVDGRVKDLMNITNLCLKKPLSTIELNMYGTTVDAIWDTYDTYLSVKVDPQRTLYNQYKDKLKVNAEIGLFLHAPGPTAQEGFAMKPYKIARAEGDPDLAILVLDPQKATVVGDTFKPFEYEPAEPSEGQGVQAVGYPSASDQIDADADKYFTPTFTTGHISRIGQHIIQVDAPITKGMSGGPLISEQGKVIGVVAVRAVSSRGGELTNFGGAIRAETVKSFAPELFGN